MLRAADILQSVRKEDWFTSTDLKDAYFHVLIVPNHRKLLRFSFKNQVYQFKVLPFGLSLAPHVFTRCMTVVLYPLWCRGMRILPYLGSWLLCVPQDNKILVDCCLSCTQTLTQWNRLEILMLGVSHSFSSRSCHDQCFPPRVGALWNHKGVCGCWFPV